MMLHSNAAPISLRVVKPAARGGIVGAPVVRDGVGLMCACGKDRSCQRVRAYLHHKRTSPRPVTARPPSPRAVAGWILRRPETLSETDQLHLKTVRAHCPELDALTRRVRSFATMLTERQGERLPDWLDTVRQDDLPSLQTLAAGIDRDRDAVIAGLTLPWNSAPWKAMSTGSRCSSARCSAAQASPSCENESCSRHGASCLVRGRAPQVWLEHRR
ncbi:hypothetical protein ACFWWT_41915 [Streptomyces sp. NPDC058676]|uniref:hypothetical protein n=1 Tax=unclassified Streptomyces TaxID=2593676 RepID=UPI00364A2091